MPRTEAGKRWMQTPAAQIVTGMADAIEAIEDEAEHRGYLRANDCDHSPCIEREAEAVAAERERITRGIARLRVDEIVGAPPGYEQGWNEGTAAVLRIIEGETP